MDFRKVLLFNPCSTLARCSFLNFGGNEKQIVSQSQQDAVDKPYVAFQAIPTTIMLGNLLRLKM
jgi:hypothetical protein